MREMKLTVISQMTAQSTKQHAFSSGSEVQSALVNVRNDLRCTSPIPQAWLFSLPQGRSLLSGCCFFQFQETNKTPKSLPNLSKSFQFSSSSDLSFPYRFSAPTFQHQIFRHGPLTSCLQSYAATVAVYFQAGLSFVSLLYEIKHLSPIQFLSLAENEQLNWQQWAFLSYIMHNP